MGTVALLLSLAPSASAAELQATAEDSDGIYQSNPAADEALTLTTTTTGRTDDGLLLTTPGSLTQSGGSAHGDAAIYDHSGELVWYQDGEYTNMQEITFRGEPALAMWESTGSSTGFGSSSGQVIVLDSSYQEVASFSMEGYDADYHSLAFNEDGTRVLMAAYVSVSYDLSEYGGSADSEVTDMIIQEVDTDTGEVTFEWSALDHIPVDETQEDLSMGMGWVDYVHTNSLSYTNNGNILMSGRNTSTIYKIDADTGEIIWRFGGENSDFTFDDDSEMPSYQHDASMLSDGTLAVFDNGNSRDPQYSRGSVWEIDQEAMTADLVEDLQPEEQTFASFTGSNQQTGNGDMLVNYGDTGQMMEFRNGEVVFTASLPEGYFSYKTESSDWVGTPASRPDVAWTDAEDDGSRDLYMSWNGSTEVAKWRIEVRTDDGRHYTRVATVKKTGFETEAEVTVPENADVFRVTALDQRGRSLGSRTLVEGKTSTVTE